MILRIDGYYKHKDYIF